MEHDVIEGPALTLVAVQARIEPDRAMEQIGALWGRFMAEGLLRRIPDRPDDHTIVAAYTDYESDHTGEYTLLLGAPTRDTAEPPDGMVRRTFAAQTYARIQATGPIPQVVQQTWQSVYTSPLPRAFTADFERYDVRNMGEHAQLELHLALRSA